MLAGEMCSTSAETRSVLSTADAMWLVNSPNTPEIIGVSVSYSSEHARASFSNSASLRKG